MGQSRQRRRSERCHCPGSSHKSGPMPSNPAGLHWHQSGVPRCSCKWKTIPHYTEDVADLATWQDCSAQLLTKNFGTYDEVWGDNAVCRQIHVLLTASRPDVSPRAFLCACPALKSDRLNEPNARVHADSFPGPLSSCRTHRWRKVCGHRLQKRVLR